MGGNLWKNYKNKNSNKLFKLTNKYFMLFKQVKMLTIYIIH